MRSHRLQQASAMFLVCILAGPSSARAAELTPRAPLSAASIARAVAGELASEVAGSARPPQTATPTPLSPKRDSLWNGVLIGAGVGAAVGAISAASDDRGNDDDFGGGCATLAGPATGAGLAVGALIGAGIGALVDALIK